MPLPEQDMSESGIWAVLYPRPNQEKLTPGARHEDTERKAPSVAH